MKRFFILIVTILCWAPAFGAHAVDENVARLENKPDGQFTPPPIQIHTFKNGLKLYFLRNRNLPVFQMGALIRGGDMTDSAAKKGLADLMMQGLKTGGTEKRSADEIDEFLDRSAISLGSESTTEYANFSVSALVGDSKAASELFFEILKSPRFDSQKVEILRQRALEGIRRRNEDPFALAQREFMQQVYGPQSIWARVSSASSIASITRNDLVTAHAQYITPDRILLAASADMDFEKMIGLVEKAMGDWKPAPFASNAPPPVVKEWEPSVQIISRPVSQSSVIMGHFGEKRFNPDKFAIVLANQVLGLSTFGSRLGSRIRTDLGLAYSVSSAFGLETDYGAFEVFARTKSATTLQVVQETKAILKAALSDKPIMQEELDNAKETILNQLIFRYADPFEIVSDRVRYDFYGYPPDYLTIYQQEIKKTDLAAVQAALAKYFFPDRLKVLIVGNPKEMGDLSSLGKVETLPLDND